MNVQERPYRGEGIRRTHDALDWAKQNIAMDAKEAQQIERFALQAITSGLKGTLGKTKKSSAGHATHLVQCLITLRRYTEKPYSKLNKEDLNKTLYSLQTSDESVYRGKVIKKKKSVNTIWHYVIALKLFLLWLSDENNTKLKREDILDIALPKMNKNTFQDTDILKPEEINEVIQACENARDRCYFSMIYDSMFRSKELAELRWKDVVPVTLAETGQMFYRATTAGKTGAIRKPLLTRSTGYITEWRNQYPGEATGDNFVFVTRSGKQFTYSVANHLISRIKDKLLAQGKEWAEKLALHQFRRASITHASNEMRPVAHVCQDAWGRSYSVMIERYNKPGQDDIDSSKLEAAGISPKRKYVRHEKALEDHDCACGTTCPPHMKFCPKCGLPLTIEAKQEQKGIMAVVDTEEYTQEDIQKAITILKAMQKIKA